ncbi:succinate dehydrogenase assembly factor 2 [Thermaurantiacus tibetensis]|uniref:FAD assembly factor SdhE n=1 Tax=Thermaurantiacus tibetensis TaxID=2759035 RepID=UPI00188DD975|nr:succinate dehydrogenase assembly factor 2 [Thermaurantiacus tibetensis]
MDAALREFRLKRARWRATHRGTKEADLLVGGFAERYLEGMSEAELGWFETLLEEQDVDILAWAFGTAAPPPDLDGPMMARLRARDYIALPG